MTGDELQREQGRRHTAAWRGRYPVAVERQVRKMKAYRRALAALGRRYPNELAALRADEERKLGL